MSRIKYPRIPHIPISHPSDDDIIINFSIFGDRYWYVTEKVDGSQICIMFDQNGMAQAYNRNTELLMGHSDIQFDLLQKWINKRYVKLYNLLGDRYILYGEWMFHVHTVIYDRLSDWFIAFGLKDKTTNQFIPFHDARQKVMEHGFAFVPLLYEGKLYSNEQLLDFIQQSHFSTHEMEGLVFHSPSEQVRCKYVTKKFQDSIDQSRHWRKDPRIRNKLKRKFFI